MRLDTLTRALTLHTRAVAWPLVLLSLAVACGVSAARADKPSALIAVAPGMTQTDLQSVLGPPDYIQVKGRRQAWQYCPHFMERLLKRNGDLVQHIERLIAREDGDTEHFITVWFFDGEVEHMRAYPEEGMGSCFDFYAAFRWEDNLDREGLGYGVFKVEK